MAVTVARGLPWAGSRHVLIKNADFRMKNCGTCGSPYLKAVVDQSFYILNL
jgi:hypothetical protein